MSPAAAAADTESIFQKQDRERDDARDKSPHYESFCTISLAPRCTHLRAYKAPTEAPAWQVADGQ